MRKTVGTVCILLGLTIAVWNAAAQTQPRGTRQAPPVEKLGEYLFRVGEIRVDTAKREIVVPGIVNRVTVLEFLANTRGGMKAYESAFTLNTDAVTFNAALVLIGLDKTRARVPTRHFDSMTPEGDAVEIWFECVKSECPRTRAEQVIYDKATNQAIPEGPWVYTGSTFLPSGQYLAELDGVLIGFVHSPAPIIENPRGAGLGRYGSVVLNPNLGLTSGTPIRLTVRALTQNDTGR